MGHYKADWRIQRKDLLSQRIKGAKDPPRRTSLRPFCILIRVKKIHYLFDPQLRVEDALFTFKSKSAAVDMAIHSWIRYRGSFWKESIIFE